MARPVNSIKNIRANSIRDEESGCLLYTKALDKDGYPRISLQGKMGLGSQVVFKLSYGDIPEGHEVDHICHVRRCVEPSHLRLLTHRQNVIQIKAYVEKRNQRIKQLIETYPQIELFPLLITLADLKVLWNCGSTAHVKACLRTMSRAYPEEFFYEQFQFPAEDQGQELALYTIGLQPSLIKRLFDE
jgi:hypothetical protein